MTGEEFLSRFQVGERLTGPPVVTRRATDESGAFILVHYLLGSEEHSSASIRERVRTLSADLRKKVREELEVDGVDVIVTDALSDFSTFQAWMDSGAQAREERESRGPPSQPAPGPDAAPEGSRTPEEGPRPPVDEPRPAPASKKKPGSYTMLFGGIGSAEERAAEESPTQAAPVQDERIQEAPAPQPEPGPPAPEVEEKAPTPKPPAEETEPSEAPARSEAPAPPASSVEKKKPGSYTMLFGGIGSGEEKGEPPSSPTSSEPADAAPEASGEQARPTPGKTPPQKPVFPSPDPAITSGQEDASPPRPEPEPTPAAPPPPPEPSNQATPTPPPAPGPEERKEKKKPGAYTQMFGAIRPEEPTHAPPPPPSPQQGPPPPPSVPPVPPAPRQKSGSPEWQRWRDTAGPAGQHIPSDDYLQRLSKPTDAGPGPATQPLPPPSGSGSAPPPPPAPSGPLFSGGGPPKQGPGHYTRVMEGLSPTPATPPPSPTKPPAAPQGPGPTPRGKSKLLPILGLVAIVVTIVVLTIVFIRVS